MLPENGRAKKVDLDVKNGRLIRVEQEQDRAVDVFLVDHVYSVDLLIDFFYSSRRTPRRYMYVMSDGGFQPKGNGKDGFSHT
jgi:hypothetical protein